MGPPHKVYVLPHPSPPITALSPCTCPPPYHQGLGKTLRIPSLKGLGLTIFIYLSGKIPVVSKKVANTIMLISIQEANLVSHGHFALIIL